MENTIEKIKAFLAQGSEHEKLDYKVIFDITSKHDLVEITKDIAAMLSSGGGTLLIGADSSGNPISDLTDEIFAKFDETKLRNMLKQYINEPIPVRSSTAYFDNHNYILIECDEYPDGFVILKADGQYPKNDRSKEVFKIGDVFVRHGSASERWQQHDVQRIISTRISREKNAWLKEAELILTRVGTGSTTNLPDKKKRLKKVMRNLKEKIKDSTLNQSDIQLALDTICLAAIRALEDEDDKAFKVCVDSLVLCYGLGFDQRGKWRLGSSFNPVELWYEILIRLPLMGGACIEARRYDLAKYIVLQRVPRNDGHNYRTWYRHALTMSARANYLPNGPRGEGYSFLSVTTNLFLNDIQYKNALGWEGDEGRDFIVSFDYLVALLTLDDIQHNLGEEFYTSFAFYDKRRVSHMMTDIILDTATRESLFKSEPPQLAYIVQQVDAAAVRESSYWRRNGWGTELSSFMAHASPLPPPQHLRT